MSMPAALPRPLLVHQADLIATFDDTRRELRGASLWVRGGSHLHVNLVGQSDERVVWREERGRRAELRANTRIGWIVRGTPEGRLRI